jgi:hypothetical protein
MQFARVKTCWLFLALTTLIVLGCETGPDVDPATLALREKYVLSTEPADAVSLAKAKTEVAEHPSIVVKGKIGGTFETGKASFMISELPQPGEAHNHAPGEEDNCPFCKHRAANAPKAIVQFVNEKEEILPIDARELLGVDKDQVVTIKGEAKLDSLETLVITASGVYLEPKQIAAQ